MYFRKTAEGGFKAWITRARQDVDVCIPEDVRLHLQEIAQNVEFECLEIFSSSTTTKNGVKRNEAWVYLDDKHLKLKELKRMAFNKSMEAVKNFVKESSS